MYRFNGVDTYALTDVDYEFQGNFAIGCAFRTTTALQGCLMGVSDAEDAWVIIMLNEDDAGSFAAGSIHMSIATDSGTVDIDFTAPGAFDGAVHRIAVRRDAGDVIDVWLDGELVVEAFDGSALAEKAIETGRPLAFGALSNDGSITDFAAVDIGEFWWIDNGVFTGEDFVKWVALGVSPRSFDEDLTNYWAGYLSNTFVIGGSGLASNTGATADHPLMVVTGDTETPATYGDPEGPRYEVFIGDGDAADPEAVDPACVVPRAYTAPSLYGTLPASSTVFVSIYAANETDRAEEATTFTIPTDAGGLPLLTPAVPTDLRAELLADGEVRLSWRYVETSPVAAAIAATFEIQIAELPDAGVPAIPLLVSEIEVTHTQPREQYSYTLDGFTSGRRYALSVSAISAGALSAGRSAQVIVRPDADAPADTELTMAMA